MSKVGLSRRSRARRNPKDRTAASSVGGYDFASGAGVVTTCPSFTGSVGPGLNDVLTTACFPSSR